MEQSTKQEQATTPTKKCAKCRRTLSLTEFYKKNEKNYESHCKRCKKVSRKKREQQRKKEQEGLTSKNAEPEKNFSKELLEPSQATFAPADLKELSQLFKFLIAMNKKYKTEMKG